MALLVASRYSLLGYDGRRVWVRGPAGRITVSGYSGVCFEIKFSGRHRGFDRSTVSSLICDRWLILVQRSSVLVAAWTTDNRWPPVVCAGRSSRALFTRPAKLDPGAHGARCAWAMAVHHAVDICSHRSSDYRPSRVNIMAQGLSTPDPSLSPTHLCIGRGHATTTHYTHHQLASWCRATLH